MSCMVANEKYIAIAEGLHMDVYDHSNHNLIDIPELKISDIDQIADIVASPDCKFIAIITSTSKRLILYGLPHLEHIRTYTLPRSASKLRFTSNNSQILIADKSGDVLIYDTNKEDGGTKLLGHLSLLLDVLQTGDGKFIITSDRDEKIKVSCFPNTYNIQTYCLGHREFVNHLELLPHNGQYVSSSSGDGTIKFWDYTNGKLCYTIDSNLDLNDCKLREDFIQLMDIDGLEVNTLPIVHYTSTQLNETTSILAIAVFSVDMLFIYKVNTANNQFSHSLEEKLSLDRFPTSIQLNNSCLFVYDNKTHQVSIYTVINYNEKILMKFSKTVQMCESKDLHRETKESNFDIIKVLYKRKFDNVQEYKERKKLRMEKSV